MDACQGRNITSYGKAARQAFSRHGPSVKNRSRVLWAHSSKLLKVKPRRMLPSLQNMRTIKANPPPMENGRQPAQNLYCRPFVWRRPAVGHRVNSNFAV